jgi:hypothetical protein
MSKLTLVMALLCALVLSTFTARPASALSANEAPKASARCADRASATSADASKVAFLRSLVQQQSADSKPAHSSRRPMNSKLARVECTSDGPVTTCCGPCGCCTWWPNESSPNCKSNC